jgi:uncharacterized cupin superfamily protein
VGVAHWDEVSTIRRDRGPMSGEWGDLGTAAGSKTTGVKRIRLARGEMPTPPHVHGSEEEIFYVLSGSGLSWQDGKTYEVRAGDCLVHTVMTEAHTLRAGDDGLEVLAFGERKPSGYNGMLPRAGIAWLYPGWTEVTSAHAVHPWEREAALGPVDFPDPEPERPDWIVNVDDVEPIERRRGDVQAVFRDLARAAGSEATGLKHNVVDPGSLLVPAHCHSAEEEIFVVLEGEGELELFPSPSGGSLGGAWGERETHPVRAGSVVARPAGTGVSHTFRAGERGLTVLAYGTRDPNDMAYYARSGKVYFRGLRLIGRLEPLDYWEGEE